MPYEVLDPMRSKLAMKLGGRYRLRDISARGWDRLADDVGVDRARVAERIGDMAARLPDAAETIGIAMRKAGMTHAAINRLTDQLRTHAQASRRMFELG